MTRYTCSCITIYDFEAKDDEEAIKLTEEGDILNDAHIVDAHHHVLKEYFDNPEDGKIYRIVKDFKN